MNSSAWITIYMPIFIIIFVLLPEQRLIQRAVIQKKKNIKGRIIMTNDVIKKYVGRDCRISTGSFGTNVVGKIIDVNENWIEVETKKGIEIINAEFVQSIKVGN